MDVNAARESARNAMNKGYEAMSELLQGNPFGSPVGSRIEQATDGALPSENWALNMEICDLINESEEGPRDAVRAIRKRLQTNMGKNHTVVMYTLTVLETVVKNCGNRLHAIISRKEFVEELVALIGPKFDPPQVIQEKVLGLVQTWADAFRGHPDLTGVIEVYEELKAKGIDFPATSLDAMVPIYTPASSHPPQVSPTHAPAPQSLTNLSQDQLAKLRSELDVVQTNMRVLREMLSELTPGQESPDSLALLQELHDTTLAMRGRVLELLQAVTGNDEVTNELLLINDELNNVFIKYDRYMKNRSRPAQDKQPAAPGAAAAPTGSAVEPGTKPSAGNLIDWDSSASGETSALNADMVQLQLKEEPVSAGGAAVAAGGAVASAASSDSYANNEQAGVALGTAVQQRDKVEDMKEMEAWLQQEGAAAAPEGTTAEFDQFLTKRAAAGEALPPASGASGSGGDSSSKDPFPL